MLHETFRFKSYPEGIQEASPSFRLVKTLLGGIGSTQVVKEDFPEFVIESPEQGVPQQCRGILLRESLLAIVLAGRGSLKVLEDDLWIEIPGIGEENQEVEVKYFFDEVKISSEEIDDVSN